MPSVPVIELLLRHLVPSITIFHGGSSSHRLKHLEKSDRRGIDLAVSVIAPDLRVLQL
ncbi:hypothetical protein S245_055567 [Arachis hypogaea]